jgi:predicted alpha/beta-hydrolase family hydrolase
MTYILENGPASATTHLIMAHGAGAGITFAFLATLAELLGERGLHVVRFEFDYMASQREGGKKRPPPRAEKLMHEYTAMIASVSRGIGKSDKIFIGGKSLGGRVASLVAEEEFRSGRIAGLICLGYPFHPPGRPEKLRTAHLAAITCPSLILQGTRDPFGSEAEIDEIAMPPAVAIHWLGDGDHDFKPRRSSGRTQADNLLEAAEAIAAFVARRR